MRFGWLAELLLPPNERCSDKRGCCIEAIALQTPARGSMSYMAIFRQLRQSLLDNFDCGWLPRGINDRRWRVRRPVEPKHEGEFGPRRWKPVGFLRFARRVSLKIQINRAVRVGTKFVSLTERVAI